MSVVAAYRLSGVFSQLAPGDTAVPIIACATLAGAAKVWAVGRGLKLINGELGRGNAAAWTPAVKPCIQQACRIGGDRLLLIAARVGSAAAGAIGSAAARACGSVGTRGDTTRGDTRCR